MTEERIEAQLLLERCRRLHTENTELRKVGETLNKKMEVSFSLHMCDCGLVRQIRVCVCKDALYMQKPAVFFCLGKNCLHGCLFHASLSPGLAEGERNVQRRAAGTAVFNRQSQEMSSYLQMMTVDRMIRFLHRSYHFCNEMASLRFIAPIMRFKRRSAALLLSSSHTPEEYYVCLSRDSAVDGRENVYSVPTIGFFLLSKSVS